MNVQSALRIEKRTSCALCAVACEQSGIEACVESGMMIERVSAEMGCMFAAIDLLFDTGPLAADSKKRVPEMLHYAPVCKRCEALRRQWIRENRWKKRLLFALSAAVFCGFLVLSVSHVVYLLTFPNGTGNGVAWLFVGEFFAGFVFLWMMFRLSRDAFGKEDSVLRAHAAAKLKKQVKAERQGTFELLPEAQRRGKTLYVRPCLFRLKRRAGRKHDRNSA